MKTQTKGIRNPNSKKAYITIFCWLLIQTVILSTLPFDGFLLGLSAFSCILVLYSWDMATYQHYEHPKMRIRKVEIWNRNEEKYSERFYVESQYVRYDFLFHYLRKVKIGWNEFNINEDSGYKTKDDAMKYITEYIVNLVKSKKAIEMSMIKDSGEIIFEINIQEEVEKLLNN